MSSDLSLERRVIELRYGEAHLSRAKVAAELQISVGKVRGIEDRVFKDFQHLEKMAAVCALVAQALNPQMVKEIDDLGRHMQVFAAFVLGRVGAADRDVREALHSESSWG